MPCSWRLFQYRSPVLLGHRGQPERIGLARIDVNGVLSSCPTSAAKRRVASSALSVSAVDCSSRGEHLVDAARKLVHLLGGFDPEAGERSRVLVTLATVRRNRESGASARPDRRLARTAASPMPRPEISATRVRISPIRSSSGSRSAANCALGTKLPPPGCRGGLDRERPPRATTGLHGREARLLGDRSPDRGRRRRP